MKKLTIIAMLSIFLAGCTTTETPVQDDTLVDSEEPIEINVNVNLEDSGLVMDANYSEQFLWTYKVSGDVPTPCHDIITEAIVAESYPEQVTVTARITDELSEDAFCTQVITKKEAFGEFTATEAASINFEVIE